ncbi:MAG: hypothetical protein GY822_13310 [Deltaproteobacteria bacterium]|nr:hypothetical protein [Deltaproteobacteria bacterium]
MHDEKSGFRVLSSFRTLGKNLARAFEKPQLELGGAAVNNKKIERLLERQGFQPEQVPVPDDLGNVDDMTIMLKLFDLQQDDK